MSPIGIRNVAEMWDSVDAAPWERALERYWTLLKPANMELEHEMEALTPAAIEHLDAEEWLEFLQQRYFRWKYTAPNRYATTTAALRRRVERIGADALLRIRDRILAGLDGPVDRALTAACDIGGLGPAGASGLLALLQTGGVRDHRSVRGQSLSEVDVAAGARGGLPDES